MDRDVAQATNPVHFVPFHFDGSAKWRRPESFAFVSRLDRILISDSELLQLSHHLPIAIEQANGRLQVVAITSPQFQRTPLTNAQGRWRRGYAPIALRCLPFRTAENAGAADMLEIAVDVAGANATALPVRGNDGTPAPEIKQTMALLKRLEAGRRRLEAAAEKHLIAGVLAPFQLARLQGKAAIRSSALTVDRNKVAALSNRRIAHISKDNFLAIDLAAACLFSQRLVPGPVSVATESARPLDDAGESAITFKPSALVDDSELFSFELFSGTKSAK
jgi:hypothetical protein